MTDTMSPIERAAVALADALQAQEPQHGGTFYVDAGDLRATSIDGTFDLSRLAAAVLEAIREPDDAMVLAGERWQAHCSDVDSLFGEMIKVAIHGPE